MKSNSQAYFEKICARRMQAYLAMETSPDEDQEQAKHLAQLMAVLPVLCRLGNFTLGRGHNLCLLNFDEAGYSQ